MSPSRVVGVVQPPTGSEEECSPKSYSYSVSNALQLVGRVRTDDPFLKPSWSGPSLHSALLSTLSEIHGEQKKMEANIGEPWKTLTLLKGWCWNPGTGDDGD